MKHFLAILSLSAAVFAAPNTLNYQGKLIDVNGVGVTGPMDFRFTFHTNASTTDTNAVWTEVLTDVYVNKGYYSVQLGAVTPITVNFADTAYYLGIKVTNSTNNVFAWQNNTELTPRVQLTPVPYAMSAFDSIPVPVGTILPYFGLEGDLAEMYKNARFIVCDGSTIGRSNGAQRQSETYKDLFILLYKRVYNTTSAAAATAWSNNLVIALPDLRGMFLRGIDDMGSFRGATNRDPDKATRTNVMKGSAEQASTLGSEEGDAMQGHRHGMDCTL